MDEPVEAAASPPARPAGLLVIIGVYLLAGVASLGLIASGTPVGAAFGALSAVLCLGVAGGLWRRSEAARRCTAGLLALSLVLEVGVLALFAAGLAGLVELPAKMEPVQKLAKAGFRLWFALWMLSCMRSDEARAWFGSSPDAGR